MDTRIAARRLTLIAAAVLAIACGGDDDETPMGPITEATITGTWTLREVSGQRLPFTAALTPEIRLEILGGRAVLGADRTYNDEQYIRIRRTGEPERRDTLRISGVWALEGNALTVRVGTDSFPGLFVNNQFLKQESGFTYSYRR